MTLILRQSYWADLTTKTWKTNGFDTIEIDLVTICVGVTFDHYVYLHDQYNLFRWEAYQLIPAFWVH